MASGWALMLAAGLAGLALVLQGCTSDTVENIEEGGKKIECFVKSKQDTLQACKAACEAESAEACSTYTYSDAGDCALYVANEACEYLDEQHTGASGVTLYTREKPAEGETGAEKVTEEVVTRTDAEEGSTKKVKVEEVNGETEVEEGACFSKSKKESHTDCKAACDAESAEACSTYSFCDPVKGDPETNTKCSEEDAGTCELYVASEHCEKHLDEKRAAAFGFILYTRTPKTVIV